VSADLPQTGGTPSGDGAGRLPQVPDDAWALLTAWLPCNEDPDRPRITLSTVDEHGDPDSCTVLLTEFSREGFSFHTDTCSRKAGQVRAHAAVALTLLWPGFTRQLVIRGSAEEAPAERVADAYVRRSPYLQQLAWQNTDAFAALPDDERVRRWAAFAAQHPAGFPQAPSWTGFLVRPTRLTFWRSAPDTASQRQEFALTGGVWTERVLAG